MDDTDAPRPPSARQLSKTPSWILLGFILGAAFVWLLPTDEQKTEAPRRREPTKAVAAAGEHAKRDLTTIEAVFAEWGSHAVWEHDLTEVALWDSETKAFNHYYEVLRSGGNFYYRPLDRLTRPILTHGVKDPDCPLRFTETEAMRQEWLHEKAQEDWKAITNSIQKPSAQMPIDPSGKP